MRTRRGTLYPLAALIVLGSLLIAGADETGPDLRIHVTRDHRGRLEPSDCKAGVLGASPRQTPAVSNHLPAPLLLAGGCTCRYGKANPRSSEVLESP